MPVDGGVPRLIGAKAYRTTTLSLSATTWTAVPMDAEAWDTGGMHDTGSNTDRLTVTVPGYYLCSGRLTQNSQPAADWYVGIAKNGSTVNMTFVRQLGTLTTGPGPISLAIAFPLLLAAGDYVSLYTYCSSAETVAAASGTEHGTFVSAVLIGV